ncbi:MAG TPA: hypothetical protein VHI51_20400 [Ktedonobacterales bacterium]|nr:hypothetical protein [Ktedonobacterales bacterium]
MIAGQLVMNLPLPHRSIFRRFTGEWSGGFVTILTTILAAI